MTTLFSEPLSKQQSLATRMFGAALAKDKLAKAYMLIGQASEDKWQLVVELTAFLNCESVAQGAEMSCLISAKDLASSKRCINCRWLEARTHPQALMQLTGVSNKSGKIAVEEARSFANEVSKTSPYYRVMIIEDAQQEILHRPAANALLKTIEEPRSKVLMIFFARVANDVLATIMSRCQLINMASSEYAQCLSLTSTDSLNKFISDKHFDSGHFQRADFALEKLARQDSSITDAVNLAETIQFLIKEGVES